MKISLIIIVVLCTLYFLNQSLKSNMNDINKNEISDKAYFRLSSEYNYIKTSPAGDAMRSKIVKGLSDGGIDGNEYKSITGEEPDYDLSSTDAEKTSYKEAKQNFLAEFKPS